MAKVQAKANEPFEVMLRRFKRICEKSGVLAEAREREFYVKPTTKRKAQKAASIKRWRRKLHRLPSSNSSQQRESSYHS